MNNYIIYNSITGLIERQVTTKYEDYVLINLKETQAYIVSSMLVDPEEYYVDLLTTELILR